MPVLVPDMSGESPPVETPLSEQRRQYLEEFANLPGEPLNNGGREFEPGTRGSPGDQ
jgi:hypothetical protein